MKNYLALSFKKNLPLYIIITAIFLIFAVMEINNVVFYESVSKMGYGYYRGSGYAGFMGIIICLFIITMFLPFFAMNYRYSLAKSDAFRQSAYKDKYIRYGEHLINLSTILISFTIAFLIIVVGLILKRNGTVLPSDTDYYTYVYRNYNFEYYIPLYFAAIVLAIGQYFISYLFISRSNTFINSLIILLLGQAALTCFISVFARCIHGGMMMIFSSISHASVVFPITYLYMQFNSLITQGENTLASILDTGTSYENAKCFSFICSTATYAGLSILGVIAFSLEKDPSSEWANKPESDKPYQEIIYHVSFGLTGLMIAAGIFNSGIIANLIFYVLFSSLYYTLYGLLHRNFKLKLKQILILVGVLAAVLFFSITINLIVPTA